VGFRNLVGRPEVAREIGATLRSASDWFAERKQLTKSKVPSYPSLPEEVTKVTQLVVKETQLLQSKAFNCA